MLRSQHCFFRHSAQRAKSESSAVVGKGEITRSLGDYDEDKFARDFLFLKENVVNLDKFLRYLVARKEIAQFTTFCVSKQLANFVDMPLADLVVLKKLFQVIADSDNLEVITEFLKSYIDSVLTVATCSYVPLIDLLVDLLKLPQLATVTVIVLSKIMMWLSMEVDNIEYFQSSSTVPAILGMMTAYKEVSLIQSNAANILSKVASGFFKDVLYPIKPTCLEIIMLTIKRHNDKMSVLRPCLQIFYRTWLTLNKLSLREIRKVKEFEISGQLKVQQCYKTLKYMQENCLGTIEEYAQHENMDDDLASNLYNILSYFKDDNKDYLKIKEYSEFDFQYIRKGILKPNESALVYAINDCIDDGSYDFCDIKAGTKKVGFVL